MKPEENKILGFSGILSFHIGQKNVTLLPRTELLKGFVVEYVQNYSFIILFK